MIHNIETLNIRTVNGKTFSGKDSAEMAKLIYRRFGENLEVAANKWRQLLDNNCTDLQFKDLVEWQG